ncbi:MAG: hypothetical protein A4S17_01330 [Proteobacteria bacterium HN_bin10]|nr:MAG: hypothetical protein A4S17_01330 [Proteobacteria bacterium HN_bin10]
MAYHETLEFLFSLQKHGIRPGLAIIEALLARLGRPERRFPSVHIGGTNGKGSTAAMAASMLRAAGYRVGLYTSPHLVDFRERIRVDGDDIPEDRVAALADRLRQAMEGLERAPTFFEFTTAMAFERFAESAVDLAVVEVGLGGRFDATNVLAPLASAITTVSIDHVEYLGRTVRDIAFEKAGIVKARTPLVTGRLTADAEDVIRQVAADRGAPRLRWGTDFRAAGDPLGGFRYESVRRTFDRLQCPLPGAHQVDNAACAVSLIETLADKGFPVSEAAVREGLARTHWEGRLETVERRPTVVLDGGHNAAAAAALAEHLAAARRDRPEARVILVVGMMRDKDRTGFLRALAPLADEIIVTQPALARATSAEELAADVVEACGGIGRDGGHLPIHRVPVPAEALAHAKRLASAHDLIYVTGSLMLVGDVKAVLRGCSLSPIRG